MLVVLVVAIAVTHIARFGTASLEGMDSEEEGQEEEEEETEEPVTEGLEPKSSDKKKTDLAAIQETLNKLGATSSSEKTTAALIEQTKAVQENMALLEPYLKAAEKATEPSQKPEGFCDYASAYKI
jgi:uncharacterized protein YaaR (DUF327 family)